MAGTHIFKKHHEYFFDFQKNIFFIFPFFISNKQNNVKQRHQTKTPNKDNAKTTKNKHLSFTIEHY